MKRALIGGILSTLGTVWGLSVLVYVKDNLASSWATPPGRFLTTIAETGMLLPFIVAILLFVLGLAAMGLEYFKRDQ